MEVYRDVFETITSLVKEGLFNNEKDALKSCLVLDQSASKIGHFDAKISKMHAKYKMSCLEVREAHRTEIGI